MWCAMWFLPWKQNKDTLSGAGAVKQLPGFLKKNGFKSILIVTDGGLYKLGMADSRGVQGGGNERLRLSRRSA